VNERRAARSSATISSGLGTPNTAHFTPVIDSINVYLCLSVSLSVRLYDFSNCRRGEDCGESRDVRVLDIKYRVSAKQMGNLDQTRSFIHVRGRRSRRSCPDIHRLRAADRRLSRASETARSSLRVSFDDFQSGHFQISRHQRCAIERLRKASLRSEQNPLETFGNAPHRIVSSFRGYFRP